MIIRDRNKVDEIKCRLLVQLKEENAFWSYELESVTVDRINDDQLIALTMRHLDLPEGDYLYTLNRFFAWYYFKAKRPDAYLKSLQTRHLRQILFD